MGLISRSTVPYTKRRCLHTCKALGTLCSLHKTNTLTVPGWQGGEEEGEWEVRGRKPSGGQGPWRTRAPESPEQSGALSIQAGDRGPAHGSQSGHPLPQCCKTRPPPTVGLIGGDVRQGWGARGAPRGRAPKLLSVGEIRMDPAVRCHLTPTGMAPGRKRREKRKEGKEGGRKGGPGEEEKYLPGRGGNGAGAPCAVRAQRAAGAQRATREPAHGSATPRPTPRPCVRSDQRKPGRADMSSPRSQQRCSREPKVEGSHPRVRPGVDGENVACPYRGASFRLQKEGNSDSGYDADEPGGHDAGWNKPVPEGQWCMMPHVLPEGPRELKFIDRKWQPPWLIHSASVYRAPPAGRGGSGHGDGERGPVCIPE